ncbi:MAG: Dabb family protein [Chitinophagia bacterium]|nr:Dabb family protein [Chitinophagia bacterium]
MYRHVVMFTFKETSSAASVDSVVNAFMGLGKKIPVVKSIEWGLNNSPENFHQGFTHCFVLTFANTSDRDAVYQKHPAHMEFQKILQPHMEKVFAFTKLLVTELQNGWNFVCYTINHF